MDGGYSTNSMLLHQWLFVLRIIRLASLKGAWRGNSACRSIRSNFICAICLANSMYGTGHRQSASTSKRGVESNAAGASRGIAIVADLLTWRPRAYCLPLAQNMLIEACGGAGLRGVLTVANSG